jgi:lipoate-protein ligase A
MKPNSDFKSCFIPSIPSKSLHLLVYNSGMALTLRVLPFATADGATNMAADEALLESAATGVASLRFYTWTEPTLSLGYFQPADARAATPGVPWVRRSTGGAAILHHHELTYALALPPGAEWHAGESWVCRVHHLLRDELADAGLAAKAVVCGEEQKLGEVLCFLDQTAGDLLIDGSKVAGSAQRKWKGALLQHGSILLRRSPHAPHLPGIHDYAGRDLFTPEQLAARLEGRIAVAAGCAVEAADWTPLERARTAQVRAEKYADRAWNGKR